MICVRTARTVHFDVVQRLGADGLKAAFVPTVCRLGGAKPLAALCFRFGADGADGRGSSRSGAGEVAAVMRI
jgi:hypothetical protein